MELLIFIGFNIPGLQWSPKHLAPNQVQVLFIIKYFLVQRNQPHLICEPGMVGQDMSTWRGSPLFQTCSNLRIMHPVRNLERFGNFESKLLGVDDLWFLPVDRISGLLNLLHVRTTRSYGGLTRCRCRQWTLCAFPAARLINRRRGGRDTLPRRGSAFMDGAAFP